MAGPDSVYRAVAEEARGVFRAEMAAVRIFDASGGPRDFVACGTDADVRADAARAPEVPPSGAFLKLRLRHMGEHLGDIVVAGGRIPAPECRAALDAFGSLASVFVAGARVRGPGRRGSGGLASMVDAIPTGVLLFDAETGGLLAMNEETRRIAGRPIVSERALNRLLREMELRRPDGRGIPFDELPTTRAVRSRETVLADDVVVHLPDGRSVNTLVNARPIPGPDGRIASVVATLQVVPVAGDAGRMRAGLRGDADHEPRAPRAAGTRARDDLPTRILVFDADRATREQVRVILGDAGFVPVVTGAPDEIERLVVAERPHVVVTDLTPPWTDGFEVMERIVGICQAPVIAASGRGAERNIGRALERGAADHVAKPFVAAELVARIDAALRRRAGREGAAARPFVLGDLEIDPGARAVAVAGRPVRLTATESRLLRELSSAGGRVLTHDHLLESVWGPRPSGDARVLRTCVKSLRRKLGDDARRPRYIFTVPGVGYRMAGPSKAEKTPP